jgi:hypothetical protein
MITPTMYNVDLDIINSVPKFLENRKTLTINEPTDTFFYDPWVMKKEYINTPWEELYNSLPVEDKGEARVIQLAGNESYFSHADIDDRYHLNLTGSKSFLIDLDSLIMYPTVNDGIWYEMDASKVHTASNFSNRSRYQLVIRKLLKKGTLINPIHIKLSVVNGVDLEDARFVFDNTLSKYLNRVNKMNMLNDFIFKNNIVIFSIDQSCISELLKLIPKEFKIE